MHDFRRFPIYNTTFASDHTAGAVLMGMLGICSGSLGLTADGVPVWAALFIGVTVFALTGIFLGLTRQMYTGTSAEYLTVRGLLRTRRTPWSDIQSIEVVRDRRGQDWVVVRDRNGRKTTLPYLTTATVPGVEEEASKLRGLWVEFRGEDWVAGRQDE
ncbi:PH domain-containing protein [Glycomyces rhizosphaerae]|uniref:PH domain-containing protein n=1 Tax=Glycomyces rhizosphaerae TaxID=2054422 RepID=A0ABV7PZ33_9ACTN